MTLFRLIRAQNSDIMKVSSPIYAFRYDFVTMGPTNMGFFKKLFTSKSAMQVGATAPRMRCAAAGTRNETARLPGRLAQKEDWTVKRMDPNLGKCVDHLSTHFVPGVNGEAPWIGNVAAKKKSDDDDEGGDADS
jgi:hypothetical protein